MSLVDCPSGKIRFSSRSAASKSRDLRRNKGQRMRPYLCPRCHGWHLTTEIGTHQS